MVLLLSSVLPVSLPPLRARHYAAGNPCAHHAETVLLDPAVAYHLPPSTARAPLTLVLLVHLFRAAHAEAVLGSWARRRCLRLARSAGDGAAVEAAATAGYVLLQPLTFDASPGMDALRPALPGAHHLALPHHFSATMRTQAALARALAQHPNASWFFKGDDDAFVHGDRLALALLARNASAPLLVGHLAPLRFGPYRFVSGGAGYALSRAALQGLAPRLDACNSEAFRHTSQEDVMVTKCARDFFGDGVLVDHPGFNWGRPEEMLATGTYSEAHARTPPVTHHYIDPARARALLEPAFPRRVLQVWPFASAPPAAAGPLLQLRLQQLLQDVKRFVYGQAPASACDKAAAAAPTAAQLRNLESCRAAAAAAGLEHVLLPAQLGALEGAGSLLQLLLPPALERLALLEALYLQGGVAVPLDTPCAAGGEGALAALLARAEAQGERQLKETLMRGPAASGVQWLLGSARHGAAESAAEESAALPGARAASQFHHAVFQQLAKAVAKSQLGAFISGEESLPPEVAGCAGAGARRVKSALALREIGASYNAHLCSKSAGGSNC